MVFLSLPVLLIFYFSNLVSVWNPKYYEYIYDCCCGRFFGDFILFEVAVDCVFTLGVGWLLRVDNAGFALFMDFNGDGFYLLFLELGTFLMGII